MTAAPLGERGPVGDGAALAAPRQMPAARARDRADQQASRPQRVPARAMQFGGFTTHCPVVDRTSSPTAGIHPR